MLYPTHTQIDSYDPRTQKGYPTKNTLKTWYREYEQRQDVSTGYVRSRLKYSEEQKQLAVDQYLDHDRCIAGTIKVGGAASTGRCLSPIHN